MRYTTFVSELKSDNSITIPPEVRDKLDLRTGDKIEISLKKIKSKRLEIVISKNPLYKLLKMNEE
jgi:AbrB family looped-hinge helix DNA binding protein